MIKIEVLPNQNVEIKFPNGNTRTIECVPDPHAAHEMAKDLIFFHLGKSKPFYSYLQYDGKSMPGLFLEELYNRYCRPFVQYRKVFEFLHDKELIVNHVVDSHDLGCQFLLKELGFMRSPPTPFNKVGRLLKFLLLGMIWLIFTITVIVICRVQLRNCGLFSYDTIWGKSKLDRRLKDVYEALWEKRVSFIEIFGDFSIFSLKNMLKRRRIALYYPPFTRSLKPTLTRDIPKIQVSHGKPEERFRANCLDFLTTKAASCRWHSKIFSKVLNYSGISRIYSIDDAWQTAPLILSAEDQGIPLTAIQHGQYCKYHIGILQSFVPAEAVKTFPKILVWGQYSHGLLTKRTVGTKSNIMIAGYPRKLQAIQKSKQRKNSVLAILYGYEFLADPKQVNLYLKAFLKKGYKLYFKARWDTPIEDQIFDLPRDQLVIIDEMTQELLDSIDICAGTSSSFMQEMSYYGLTLWYLDTTVDYFDDLVDCGFAHKITYQMLINEDFNPFDYLSKPTGSSQFYAKDNVAAYLV